MPRWLDIALTKSNLFCISCCHKSILYFLHIQVICITIGHLSTIVCREYNLAEPYMTRRRVALNLIQPGRQHYMEAWNSPLSEAAVLGFEYGFSLGCRVTIECPL